MVGGASLPLHELAYAAEQKFSVEGYFQFLSGNCFSPACHEFGISLSQHLHHWHRQLTAISAAA